MSRFATDKRYQAGRLAPRAGSWRAPRDLGTVGEGGMGAVLKELLPTTSGVKGRVWVRQE